MFLVNKPLSVDYFVFATPIRAKISLTPVKKTPRIKQATMTFFSLVLTPNRNARPLVDQVMRLTKIPMIPIDSFINVSVVLKDWTNRMIGQTIMPGLFVNRCTQKNGKVKTISDRMM